MCNDCWHWFTLSCCTPLDVCLCGEFYWLYVSGMLTAMLLWQHPLSYRDDHQKMSCDVFFYLIKLFSHLNFISLLTSLALIISLSLHLVFQSSAGLPWRPRSVLCRWGSFPQQCQGRMRSTAQHRLMTSLRKWVRVTMSALAVTWALWCCPFPSWHPWSSSASSRPPVLATGASAWFPAHILSFTNGNCSFDFNYDLCISHNHHWF